MVDVFLEVTEQPPKAEVLASGICVHEGEEFFYDQPQSATGYAHFVSELVITEPTSTVPLEKGIRFGFKWQVTGLPSTFNLTYRVEHPLITRPDGTQLRSSDEPMIHESINGTFVGTDCYMLREDYELVPGEWAMSVLMDGVTVAKQTYQVVRSK